MAASCQGWWAMCAYFILFMVLMNGGLLPGGGFSDAEHARYALQMCTAAAYNYMVGGEWFMSLGFHKFQSLELTV